MFDVAEEASKEMLLSGFKEAIHPKPTYLGLWKKGQVHESRGITYTIYKCPMSGRAGCRCMLRLVMAKDSLELQHCGTANFAITRSAMHKMIPRSSSTNKWLQSGLLLSLRQSFLHLCFAETCSCTTVPPRQFQQSTCAASSIRSTVPAMDDSYGKLQEFADCHL